MSLFTNIENLAERVVNGVSILCMPILCTKKFGLKSDYSVLFLRPYVRYDVCVKQHFFLLDRDNYHLFKYKPLSRITFNFFIDILWFFRKDLIFKKQK